MAGKNPVMPLYYNDFRGSTQDWTDEEAGAYIRLLIYQWDKLSIPTDEKRRNKIADSAIKNWGLLSSKFPATTEGELKNERLEEIREQKKKHSEKQVANVAKRYKKFESYLPNNEIEIDEEETILDNYEPDPPKQTEPVFHKGADVLIVPELVGVWLASKKDYVFDAHSDAPAVRQIAEMIATKKGLEDYTSFKHVSIIKTSFLLIVNFVITHNHYKDYQLSQVAKYFNAITSAMQSAKDGTNTDQKKAQKESLVKNNIYAAAGARDILKGKYDTSNNSNSQ